jgi:hypothetical protein
MPSSYVTYECPEGHRFAFELGFDEEGLDEDLPCPKCGKVANMVAHRKGDLPKQGDPGPFRTLRAE